MLRIHRHIGPRVGIGSGNLGHRPSHSLGIPVLNKITKKELVRFTKFRTFAGESLVFLVVFCDVGRAFGEEMPRESVKVSVDKNRFQAGGHSLLADLVTSATRELFAEIKTKFPDRIE